MYALVINLDASAETSARCHRESGGLAHYQRLGVLTTVCSLGTRWVPLTFFCMLPQLEKHKTPNQKLSGWGFYWPTWY